MPRRYFNWKLAVVLIIGTVVVGGTALGLRNWRLKNSAQKALERGIQEYDANDWRKAAADLGRYISINQNDVDVLTKYADAQLKIRPSSTDNVLQATQAYRIILRTEPNNINAAKQLTQIYFLMGRYGDAELISGRLLENNPDPELGRLHAMSLIKQRKFHDAAGELKKLCAENPKQVLAYEVTGQLAEQHPEEFSEPAVYWFNQAVKNNSSSALAYAVRAGFYRRGKDIKLALADMEKAETQDLSDPAVCLRLASEYINMKIFDKADKMLEKVQQISPASQDLWQLAGQAALMSQSSEKMIEIAQEGLKELSSQPWDFMPLATELYIRSGEFDKASEYISKLKQNNFEQSMVLYLEGLAAEEKGNLLDAAKQWERAIEAGNTSNRLKLELASVFSRLGDTQSAINQLRSLVSANPESFEGQVALAKILAQSGNWTQAQVHAVKAVQLEPGNSEALLLQLQTQMQIDGSNSDNTQNLQNANEILAKMESSGVDSIDAGLLQLEIEMQKGNFSMANELINQLKQKYPAEIRVFLAEAELLASRNKTEDAKSVLKQAIKKFPDAIGPVKYLASLLNSQGDKDGCSEVISEALKRIDQPLAQRDLTLLLSAFYTSWGEQAKAYHLLEVSSQKLPEDIPVKRRLLQCEAVYTNSEKAQQVVDEIKKLEGENGWQWRYEQARLWYLSDNFKDHYPEIVSLMQKNILSNPDNQSSRMLLAKSYEKAGESQLAISAYREALSRSPDNVQILAVLISALYKIREFDQADELLKRLPKQSMKNPMLQKLQLQNLLRQGQFESASDILKDLVGNDPNNQDAGLTLAMLFIQQDKYAESQQLLSTLKVNNPNSVSVAAAQIQLYLKLNKLQDALDVCDETINNLNNASAYILRAKTYATLNQPQKAIKDFDKAIEIKPGNAEVWMARSDFYSSTGKNEKALSDISKAMSLDSNNEQIRKRKIELLLTSGRPEKVKEGKELIEQALKASPDDTDLLLYKANSLLIEGTSPAMENARQILQKMSRENPELSQTWLMLGEIMLKKNQPGSAMDYASRGLAYKPNDEKLLFLKARAEAVRSPFIAIGTLKELCNLNPDNVEAATLLVNIYVTTGEPAKAVSFLQNELTKCSLSNKRTFNIILATALYKGGNKTQATKNLDSLLESEPNDPSPLLAQVYLLRDDRLWDELKNKTLTWYKNNPENSHTLSVIAGNIMSVDSGDAKKTAEELLQSVLANKPENSEAIYSLAVLFGMTGRAHEAADMYRKLLDLEPDNIIAINNLSWIMCENMGQPREALELAQKGLKQAPDYIDLIDTRGMAYFRLGLFQKAADDFSKCVEMYPESTSQAASSRFHLAKAYAALKDNSRAIGYLKQVLDAEDQAGGLSDKELAEAKSLLKKLQEDI